MKPQSSRLAAAAFCLPLVLSGAGCMWAPRSQMTSLEAHNQRLTEQQKAQLAEISNLRAHSREIENQLLHTEKELAVVESQSAIDRHRLAAYAKEREYLHQQFMAVSRPEAPAIPSPGSPAQTQPVTASRQAATPWAKKSLY